MTVINPELGEPRQAGAPRAAAAPRAGDRVGRQLPARAVLVCIEQTSDGRVLRDAGLALARVLSAPVALVQVLETGPAPGHLPDPLVSAVRRREARSALERLATTGGDHGALAATVVLEGTPAREIRQLAHEAGCRAIVIGRNRQGGEMSLLGTTTREILEHLPTSLFLLPPDARTPFLPDADRPILVPLDGSEWAESALPVAVALARATGAAIRIVHVLEPARGALPMPPEAADLALRRKMSAHERAQWQAYLDRVSRALVADGCKVGLQLLADEDPRLALTGNAGREPTGMLVMSARGQSRSRLVDLPVGSVASYLAARVEVAMLIVQTNGSPLLRPATAAASPTGRLRRFE